MSFAVGAAPIQQILYEGARPSLMVGGKTVWAQIFDDFNRPDQPSLTSPWVIETPLNAWHVGVSGFACRMMVPDGLGVGALVTDQARHSTVCSADDGHLEIQVANAGDPGFHTRVWRRYQTVGGGYGVGLDLVPSRIWITYRALDVNVPVVDCGVYSTGDVLRLYQAGDLHTVYRNGTKVGKWNDQLHLGQKGAAYRSVAIHVQGAKQSLGPRRFSASLNYIEAA